MSAHLQEFPAAQSSSVLPANCTLNCGPHHRVELTFLSAHDVKELYYIWRTYRDDLSYPWYYQKPVFTYKDFTVFHGIVQKVIEKMSVEFMQPLVLDQATISNTNKFGHPKHADNVCVDSVWEHGVRVKQVNEAAAIARGAHVVWRHQKTGYRSYSCSVSLSDPNFYAGGELQFYKHLGDTSPLASYKCAAGTGVAFCGCQHNIHSVSSVKDGWRLVLLVWTRPPHIRVSDDRADVCYFRRGTGYGVWLTTSDIARFLSV